MILPHSVEVKLGSWDSTATEKNQKRSGEDETSFCVRCLNERKEMRVFERRPLNDPSFVGTRGKVSILDV